MCNHVKHVCMCLLVSSLLFPINPFTTDNLLTPNNLHSRYQCSTRYSINIIMTILGHHPRASHTPCLLGLIPKGRTNPVSLGTKTQGQDQPHTPTSECLPRVLQGLSPKDPRSHITIYQMIRPVASLKHFATNKFSEYDL